MLEEALESFLRQTYTGPKELIIFNDNPGIKLEFSHPEVKIFNCNSRYPNLGAKKNAANKLASLDLIVPWPDDDIQLPSALETYAKFPDSDFLSISGYWFWNKPKDDDLNIQWVNWMLGGIIITTKNILESVGGYPSRTTGEDGEMRDRLAREEIFPQVINLDKPNGFYIYRRGVGPYHVSGHTESSAWKICGGIRDKVNGDYELNPHWDRDYISIIRKLNG
jgi:hypothetical protein